MKSINTSLELKEILVVKATEIVRAVIFPSNLEAKKFCGDVEGMSIREDKKSCIANFAIPVVFFTNLNFLPLLLTFYVELRKFEDSFRYYPLDKVWDKWILFCFVLFYSDNETAVYTLMPMVMADQHRWVPILQIYTFWEV